MSDQMNNKVLLDELRALQLELQAMKSTHDTTIAEHQQVVAQLEKNESVLKKAEEIAKFGNWQAFLDESRLRCSEGAARIYGLPSKDVTFESVKKLALPSYRPLLDEAWNNLIVHGKPYNVEFKIKRGSDGEIIDIHSVAEYDSVNRIGFGTIHDITEQKRIEEVLAKNEEQYRLLYANMIEGSALHTLIYDKNGLPVDYRIVEVNPAFSLQLGISRSDVLNKSSKEAYGVDTPPYFEIYSRVALTGQHETFETYYEPLDKYFSISVFCPYKGSFATIFENITERKKAEIENVKTHQLLRDTQLIGKIGGWEMALDSQKLKWTEEMYAIHEVDESFVPDVELRNQFYTPESLIAIDLAVRDALQHNTTYEVDLEIITAKGNHRFVKTMGKVDLENQRIYGFFQDITDRKQAELKLIESETKLKELNATKDKFFSIIAHDLKSPFNGILGFSEMLKKEVRNLDNDSIEKFTDIIHSTALQAYGLLENLLEWSKTQQNGLSFEPRKLLLRNLISDEMAGLKLNADQKDISLLNETDEELLLTADEKMLRTVVRNLISNALKFTPKGGVVRVDARGAEADTEVTVTDSGVGMNHDTLEKLFKIESSFSTRGTENERGTGLGLLLCKEFVEKHGGKIWGISEKGKGSTFKFTIPILPTKKGLKLY